MRSETFLSINGYVKIFNDTDEARCTQTPPVKPKPSEIFVYTNVARPEDWRSDQYRWIQMGKKKLPQNNPSVTCTYFKEFTKGSYFLKRAYRKIVNNIEVKDRTIVQYTGSLDNVKERAHGNRKKNEHIPHTMTAKSQRECQKDQLKKAPMKVYRSLLEPEKASEHPLLDIVMGPKNPKQVRNSIDRARAKRSVSNDDVLGVYLLHDEIDFVQHMTLLRQYSVILYSEKSIEEFAQCVESDVQKSSVVLYYDTTFELGDFFLSVLSYKHHFFSNAPTVPLVYMLHDRKLEEVHTHFFTTLCNKFACFNSKLNIVTDRENAIVNAIRKSWPLSRHYPCWNHIQRDVKFWLKRHKGSEDDIKIYTSHVWDLMDSNNELEFSNKFEKMKHHWSKEFKEYYNSHLKNDVLKTVKWKLVEQNIYIDRSGITTNAAESLNSLIKRCTDNREMSSQALVLSLFYLDMYYRKEILRGKCLQGTFELKPELLEFKLDAGTVDWPETNINLTDIPYVFTNRDFKTKSSESIHTSYSAAKRLILENKVNLVPLEQVFIVSGEKKKYIVTLYPSETCSCMGKKGCHHILAAKMSIGVDKQVQSQLQLTKLIKNKRGYRSGRKTEPKSLKIVEAAADSTIIKSGEDGTSILLPTIEKKIVKSRFIDPVPETILTVSHNSRDHELIEMSFEGVKTSTPRSSKCKRQITSDLNTSGKKRKLLEEKPEIVIVSMDEVENLEDLMSTANESFDQRRDQIVTLGIDIYPSHLKPLKLNTEPKEGEIVTRRFLMDSVIELYIRCLIHERLSTEFRKEIYCTEGTQKRPKILIPVTCIPSLVTMFHRFSTVYSLMSDPGTYYMLRGRETLCNKNVVLMSIDGELVISTKIQE
ncbi:hypothetical protein WDU94_009841 [Cyamophila willieti]